MKLNLTKKHLPLLLFLLPAGVILWHLLLPGYVLTLDMGFAPHIARPTLSSGALANGLPHVYVWYMLGLVLPGWIVQKIMLLMLFVLLFCIPFRFLRITNNESRITSVFIALFYTMNPFVYTRFLAGQWGILYAYALAPLAFASLFELITPYQEGARSEERGASLFSKGIFSLLAPRSSLLSLYLALIFIFSPHIGAMLLIATGFAYLWRFIASKENRIKVVFESLVHAGVFLVLTSYWTIPALIHRSSLVMGSFGTAHWEAFKTTAHPVIGTLGNVITLYGFWGERNKWAEHFYWMNKTWAPLTIISASLIGALIILGIICLFKNKETRLKSSYLSFILIISIIFSCGIGDGVFRSVNYWMFEHIPFWQGFRDSQKWTTLIVICYAIFAGVGLEYLFNKVARKHSVSDLTPHSSLLTPIIPIALSITAVLAYSAPMLFGFSGLLKPVWYPKSWNRVNQIIKYQPNCKAIYLPWHMYYESEFADGKLISNPAKRFFNCNILTSENVEMEGIRRQGAINPAYDAIDGVVIGSDPWTPEQAIEVLKAAGIQYVIAAKDMAEVEPLKYEFLKAKGLHVQDFGDIVLYSF